MPPTICDGCGLPERGRTNDDDGTITTTTTTIPLKRCSRCKSVWYHDATCQRSHFPIHKKECKKLQEQQQEQEQRQRVTSPNGVSDASDSDLKPKPQVRAETSKTKGHMLVANSTIAKGQRIKPSDDTNQCYWNPLVPPILNADYRTTRCGYCFGCLHDQQFYRFDEIQPPRPQYVLLFCSARCRDRAKTYNLDKEAKTISSIYSNFDYNNPPPPKMFSTAILVYRLILGITFSTNIKMQLKTLQYEYNDDNDNDRSSSSSTNRDDYHHTKAVIATVSAMMQHSNSLIQSSLLPTLDDISKIINQIKINGFAICDGELCGIGVGIYANNANYINHSCEPNTIQTFSYGQQGQTPKLILTCYTTIQTNEEISISYVDNSSPRNVRQRQLQKDYSFYCTCHACCGPNSMDLESKLIGLRCLECSNNEQPAIVVATANGDDITLDDKGAPSTAAKYQCPNCSNTEFQCQIKLMKLFQQQSEGDEVTPHEFENMQRLFLPGSWSVQEYGERLAQLYLDQLSPSNQDFENQHEAANKARSVFKTLLKSTNYKTSSASCMFRRQLIIYKAAKLDLFLGDKDPLTAISQIKSVEEFYSTYMPKNHEHIQGLQQCLQSGM